MRAHRSFARALSARALFLEHATRDDPAALAGVAKRVLAAHDAAWWEALASRDPGRAPRVRRSPGRGRHGG